MLDTLQVYFAGEKAESLVFIAAGVVGLLGGVVFLFRGAFLKGMAGPLMAVALIHLVVGGTVYSRTDAQVATLTQQLQQDPVGYRTAELQRMQAVNANFDLYRRIEIGLIALGVLGFAAGWARRRRMLAGAGAGLAWQAAFTLFLDFFAEARADTYTAAILALAV